MDILYTTGGMVEDSAWDHQLDIRWQSQAVSAVASYIQCSPKGMDNTLTSLICARLGKLGPARGRASLLGELLQLGTLLKIYSSVVAYFVFDLVWFSFLLYHTRTHVGVHTHT